MLVSKQSEAIYSIEFCLINELGKYMRIRNREMANKEVGCLRAMLELQLPLPLPYF